MSDNGSDNENWVLGVTLGLLGSIAINTGNNIQSLGLKALDAQNKIEPEPATEVRRSSLPSLPWLTPPKGGRTPLNRKSWLSPSRARTAPLEIDDRSENEFVVVPVAKKTPVQSITWVLGTIVFVSGSLLNFASYAFAAQSLLASLESVQFVTNLLFGRFLLGAHVTQSMLAGTCLAVTGTVMAVQFSSKETLDLNTSEIKDLYHNRFYQAYLAVAGVLIVLLKIVYKKLTDRKKANRPIKHSDTILPSVYSVSSALFGTQSVVQAKVLAELLAVHSSGEENIFESWFTYVTLFVWIVTVLVWLKRLNDALKVFDPLFIIPQLQCCFIFFAIVSGGIFFKEFNAFNLRQWFGFWFGIVVMFSGLILLIPKPKSTKDDELHRQLVNLLLEKRSLSHLSVERTPRSPAPTPNHSLVPADDASGEGEQRRSPRLSKENLTSIALDAVKDMFSGDPSARALSEVMVQNSVSEGDRRRRRNALEKLLTLIRDNPISTDGSYNAEITGLIQELQLDVPLSPAPGPDIRDMAKHHSLTQERLRSTILWEIEKNLTPQPKTPPRELTLRADNRTPTRTPTRTPEGPKSNQIASLA
ncbi:hypothetical protein ACHAXT_010533 [Thalassiosira profunda]